MKWTILLPLLSILCAATNARATPNFPPEIASHLSLVAPPQCSLCHHDGVTGKGTVTTPFGTSMRAQGLVEFDTASLRAALDTLETSKADSDGDCVADVDELRAGTNPDVPDNPDAGTCDNGESAAAANAPPPPIYGCQLRVASEEPQAGRWWMLAPLALAVLRALTRRRRRASDAPSRSGNT